MDVNDATIKKTKYQVLAARKKKKEVIVNPMLIKTTKPLYLHATSSASGSLTHPPSIMLFTSPTADSHPEPASPESL